MPPQTYQKKNSRSYVPRIFCLISTFARSTESILAFALKISVTSLKLNDDVLARMLEFLERQLNMNMISKFHTGIVFPPFSLHKYNKIKLHDRNKNENISLHYFREGKIY